ncbi:MAG: hypothetical protein Q7W44_10390 [Coriobacteriia bacterium]|nr:hypothetical protein [Coriobacteriia bacterium]
MSPKTVTVEVCSGPNDGESARSESGTLTIGSRGAANLPLAGEPNVPELASITVTAEGGSATIASDTDFEYAGRTGRSADGVTLPAFIRLGGVDLWLCVGELPEPSVVAAAAVGTTSSANPTEVGPMCSDCGLVNPPGATRCERCRRWLD